MSGWSYKGGNSIARYMVGAELATALKPDVLRLVSGLHSKLKDDLPRKVEQQAFTFQVGQQQPLTNLGGVLFDLIERDGTIVQQLAIMPNVIFFMTIRYTRWNEFWALAERLMNPVLSVVLQYSGISAVVLEANNRFYWSGAETDIDCSSLIQRNCAYICPNVISHRYLSHSFHGFATPAVDPKGRRIDNINFSLLERIENKNPVDLILSYRLLFDNAISGSDDMTTEGVSDFIGKKFKILHDANNRRFIDTIVPDIWKEMDGLTAS